MEDSEVRTSVGNVSVYGRIDDACVSGEISLDDDVYETQLEASASVDEMSGGPVLAP